MDRDDFLEAVESHINRWQAILELAKHSPDIEEDKYLFTLVEDAFEYTRDLAIEVCDKENPIPFSSKTRHQRGI